MASIFDYIYSMNAAAMDNPTGDGFCVAPLFEATSTATSGVVGICIAPLPTVVANADWAPFGQCIAPLPQVTGTTDGYRPAWGDMAAPVPEVAATAHVVIESLCLAPPAFCVGYAGAQGAVAQPLPTAYALSGYNRTADAICTTPAAAAEAYSCGLDNPLTTSPTSAQVVALLQQGNIPIADEAAFICAGMASDDAKGAALARYVAGFTYVAAADGTGDRWTCALATMERRYGDCEDGAILLQSMILAIGIDPSRVMTCFGTADGVGHAWTIYRRESDEEWVPLEWTDPSLATIPSLSSVKRMVDLTATYTAVQDILTSTAFSAITAANWLKAITTLRGVAAVTAPLPQATGRTNIVAAASMVAPLPRANGQTGARADLSFPKPTVLAAAHVVLTAAGVCLAPLAQAGANAGGQGSCAAPVPAVHVLAGARSDCVMPLPTVAAVAGSRALVTGSMAMRAPTVLANALTSVLASGDCRCPMPGCRGTSVEALVATGAVTMPRAAVEALASIVSCGAADLTMPLPIVRGQARGLPAWATQILQYDSVRIA